MHTNRLKPYNLNMGIISDGQLVSMNTVKQLFDHIRKMRGDLESSENNEEILNKIRTNKCKNKFSQIFR